MSSASSAPQPPVEAGLSTGGVARRLGVSPTTIRSWERRYGIGPAHREAGHHRRWTPDDLAALEEMCRLTARGVPPGEAARQVLEAVRHGTDPEGAPASGPPGAPEAYRAPGGGNTLPVGTVRPECRGLARAAVRLDSGEVARILRDVVDTLGPVTAWTEVMAPALRAAGRKWAAEGERYVEVEHLLSWHVSTALRRVADRVGPAGPDGTRPGPPVLLAGMPGELHTLPLEAVAAGLAERGLPYRMFGQAMPSEALLEAVRRTGPSAVMVWSQARPTADPVLVRRVAATAWGGRGARTRPAVLAAGPGWAGSRRHPGLLRPRDLATALDQLELLLGG
ncbi:MerR family transcriptional regulator [Kitasatospora cinereorecta]|uniref:MerR family transcriptional regulator n=1 Tax=Kitasatospora cinereorecta TaxID=285560 RepID=A0ABW0VD88_9ACTN